MSPAAQPFTAPAVSPPTIRLWKNSTITTTGMVTTIEAAAVEPVGWVNCDAPGIAAGTVCAAVVAVSENANTKSFQAKLTTRITVTR